MDRKKCDLHVNIFNSRSKCVWVSVRLSHDNQATLRHAEDTIKIDREAYVSQWMFFQQKA